MYLEARTGPPRDDVGATALNPLLYIEAGSSWPRWPTASHSRACRGASDAGRAGMYLEAAALNGSVRAAERVRPPPTVGPYRRSGGRVFWLTGLAPWEFGWTGLAPWEFSPVL